MLEEYKISNYYTAYRKGLYNYIKKIINDSDYSEDILQDCFHNLIRYNQKFEFKEDNIKAFLYKTAYHLSLNFLKKNRKTLNYPLEIIEQNHYFLSIQQNTDSYILSDMLTPFIDTFDSTHKSILLMKLIDRMTSVEIAKKLGISERTVRRKLLTVLVFLKNNYKISDFF